MSILPIAPFTEQLPIAPFTSFVESLPIATYVEPPIEIVKKYYKAIIACDINLMSKFEKMYPAIYKKKDPFWQFACYEIDNPLLIAIRHNHFDVVKHLSKYDSLFKVNRPLTLSEASERCRLDIMEYLVNEHGYRMAITIAESCYEFAIMSGDIKIMKHLELKYKWNPFTSKNYINPLILAVFYNQGKAYDYIKDKYPENYDIHVRDNEGKSLYENAVQGGCYKVIVELDKQYDFYNKYVKNVDKNKTLNLLFRTMVWNGFTNPAPHHISTRKYLIATHNYKSISKKEFDDLSKLYRAQLNK